MDTKFFANSYIKKERRKIILKFGFFKKNFSNDLPYRLFKYNNLIKKKQNFWWIIIGDFLTDRIFLCKKVKDLTELRVELEISPNKNSFKIKIFAINQFWCYLDKEAKFDFNNLNCKLFNQSNDFSLKRIIQEP